MCGSDWVGNFRVGNPYDTLVTLFTLVTWGIPKCEIPSKMLNHGGILCDDVITNHTGARHPTRIKVADPREL